MLDRFLKLIVTLTLLFFLLQAVIGLLVRSFNAAQAGATSALGHAGSFLGNVLVVVVEVLFLVGLLVRGAQFVAGRDPRAARERAARERAVRQRARRPAEGAPPVNMGREDAPDPDPAVNDRGEGA
jgi:hypothetical protein